MTDMGEHIDIKTASRPPRLDDRPLARRVGLIILATDHTTEVDFARMVSSERIGAYVSRIHYANPTTPENLRAMQPSLTTGAELILPGEQLDAIMYSCTAASVVIGDDEVAAAIRKAKPGVPVVTPTAAAVLGLKAFGARHISVLTPYIPATSRPMANYFAGLGFAIDRFTCLGLTDDREMARIAPAEIIQFAIEATDPRSEALFISCTAVRSAGVAAEIERAIGKPVVTSNLATAWHCLRICSDTASRPEFGRLMTMQLPEA
jgi:maleate isomerase